MISGREEFYGKRSIMTPAEQRFFAVLEPLVPGRFIVLSQVRLESIIGVAKGSRFGTRNMIDRKSVDFVLADVHTYATVLVIELDDSTHEMPERMRRDDFVDAALASAGVRILHVPGQTEYAPDQLMASIEAALVLTPVAHLNDQSASAIPFSGVEFFDRVAKFAPVIFYLAESFGFLPKRRGGYRTKKDLERLGKGALWKYLYAPFIVLFCFGLLAVICISLLVFAVIYFIRHSSG